jgi:hypothetical protein
MPTDHSVRSDDRQCIIHLGKQPADTSQYQSVNRDEGRSAGTSSPQHIDLLPQDQNFCLKRNATAAGRSPFQRSVCTNPTSSSSIARFSIQPPAGWSLRQGQAGRPMMSLPRFKVCPLVNTGFARPRRGFHQPRPTTLQFDL